MQLPGRARTNHHHQKDTTMSTTGMYNPGNYQPPTGPRRNWVWRHKAASAVLVLLALFVVIGVAGGTPPDTTTTTTATTATAATGTTTATTTAGTAAAAAVDPAEQAAIDRLHPGCTESGPALGREAGRALQLLQQHGVTDETVLTVLVHLRDSIPPGVPDMNCADVLGAYISLRTAH